MTQPTPLDPADLVDTAESWPVLGSRDLYRGGAPFAIREDTVTMPDGSAQFDRIVVEHPGAVVVLALDEDDRVLVLRQYRHACGTKFIEVPAGLLDVPGEDPVVAARRELLEEAGLEASEWTHLSSIHSSPGITAERIELYLARGLTEVPDRGGFALHHEELDMTLHWVPFEDLLEAALERRITDGPLVTALLAHEVLRRR